MNLQDQLSHPVFPLIRKIAKQLESPAYLVGGYVRDLLIHRPSTDIDCTVMGDGIGLARALCLEIGKQTGLEPELLVFKQFGTCKFHYGDTEIEFVGARKESYTPGSRKPHVEQGGLEDDLNRRDFSINAMAVSLNEKDYGALIDPFQGLEDLDHQTVRSHRDPVQSFQEDPLRMFRAVRFASQLYFDIEPDTFSAIVQEAGEIRNLSAERITEEFDKLLLSPKPSYGIKLLDAAGLLELFFPEMIALKGVETRNGKAHKDNFEHTLDCSESCDALTISPSHNPKALNPKAAKICSFHLPIKFALKLHQYLFAYRIATNRYHIVLKYNSLLFLPFFRKA